MQQNSQFPAFSGASASVKCHVANVSCWE